MSNSAGPWRVYLRDCVKPYIKLNERYRPLAFHSLYPSTMLFSYLPIPFNVKCFCLYLRLKFIAPRFSLKQIKPQGQVLGFEYSC